MAEARAKVFKSPARWAAGVTPAPGVKRMTDAALRACLKGSGEGSEVGGGRRFELVKFCSAEVNLMLNPYIEAHELRELVRRKEVRPREVAEFFLARVEKLNPQLGAFMTVTAERALADAARIEKMSAAEAATTAAVRRCVFAQGLALDQRYSHHLRLEELRELARAGGRGTGRAAGQLGRNPARQNYHPRVRPAPDYRGRSVSARAKSVEPGAHGRRIERRIGRAPSPRDCIRWRRAATAEAQYESRRHAAGWWESSRRAGESRARRRKAKHGRDYRRPGRSRARSATQH